MTNTIDSIDLSSDISLDSIYTELSIYLNDNPTVFGSALAFNPEVLDAAPFVFRGNDGLEQTDIADSIDYTETVWYQTPLEEGEAAFSPPYFDVGGAGEDIVLTTYSIPLFNADSELTAVLTNDYLLATVDNLESQQLEIQTALDSFEENFNFDPNNDGTFSEEDLPGISTQLETYLNENNSFYGSAFAYNPEVLNAAPFVLRGDDGLEQIDIADSIDYTETVWYQTPLELGEAAFSAPYFDVGGAGEDILLTTYSIPVFDESDSSLVGVLTTDLLLGTFEPEEIEAQQEIIEDASVDLTEDISLLLDLTVDGPTEDAQTDISISFEIEDLIIPSREAVADVTVDIDYLTGLEADEFLPVGEVATLVEDYLNNQPEEGTFLEVIAGDLTEFLASETNLGISSVAESITVELDLEPNPIIPFPFTVTSTIDI